MTETHTDGDGTWSVPQCPFAIDYSPRVLDDIRLAVMDAFFSLPRGGAEIGGVLIGRHDGGRLIISDYAALDCEHAMGPSFTLSQRDEAKLQELLAEVRQRSEVVPVGWYHSHTRSEIFLSDADLMIHRRFFPEAWQVALVMKPHTFQPMRCGFFFREPSGSIQATATYQEFTLEPLPMRTLPSGEIPLPAETVMPRANDSDRSQAILVEASPAETVTVEDRPEPASAASRSGPPPVAQRPEPEPTPPVPPVESAKPAVIEPSRSLFVEPPSERASRWLKVAAALALGAAIGIGGYQTRQQWWPKLSPFSKPAPAAPTPVESMGLVTIDAEGQLQIRWNRSAPAVLQATGGKLTINDGGASPREINVDTAMLRSGNFTYARTGDSVTVVLALNEPAGREAREVAAFVGKAPPPKPVPATAPNSGVSKQRDAALEETARLQKELAAEQDRNQAATAEASRLKKDLAAQTERSRKLQKQLDDARALLRQDQRKRLATQTPR